MNITDLLRRLENLIRLGTIHEVDYLAARCQVAIGEITTDWLPFFALRAGTVSEWNPPSSGEQVIVFSPSGELTNGLVFTGLYSDANPAPDDDPHTHTRRYADGALIRYNQETHTLDAVLPDAGTLNLTCPGGLNITAVAGVKINANVDIIGKLTVSDDVIVALISFLKHLHGGVLPGGAKTLIPEAGPA